MHADSSEQTQAFMDGRLRQLEARMAELTSEIAAAAANREEAERALARATPLAETKTITNATFEKAKRDVTVATETHAALRHRLAGVEVEAASLRKGVFIGDSYNDRPRSSQRADEVAQRLSEVTADLRERETQLASLRTELADETRRYCRTRRRRAVGAGAGQRVGGLDGTGRDRRARPGAGASARLLGRGRDGDGGRSGLQPAAHRRSRHGSACAAKAAITRGASSA